MDFSQQELLPRNGKCMLAATDCMEVCHGQLAKKAKSGKPVHNDGSDSFYWQNNWHHWRPAWDRWQWNGSFEFSSRNSKQRGIGSHNQLLVFRIPREFDRGRGRYMYMYIRRNCKSSLIYTSICSATLQDKYLWLFKSTNRCLLSMSSSLAKALTGFFKSDVKSALCFCKPSSKSRWAPGCLLCRALFTTTARSLKAPHRTALGMEIATSRFQHTLEQKEIGAQLRKTKTVHFRRTPWKSLAFLPVEDISSVHRYKEKITLMLITRGNFHSMEERRLK